MLLSVVGVVVRAVRRAVDADMAERVESLGVLLERARADLDRSVGECAQFMARATLLGIELAAAEAEIERLSAGSS